jgi:hypothetical protein
MQRSTLYNCFFSFFLPSETLFTSFTKENHQQQQQLLVYMQRRSEHLPLLLPLKLFPHYSPINTNQEKQLLYVKKIKTLASSSSSSSSSSSASASSSQTISTSFTKKHQLRTTTSLCKEDHKTFASSCSSSSSSSHTLFTSQTQNINRHSIIYTVEGIILMLPILQDSRAF